MTVLIILTVQIVEDEHIVIWHIDFALWEYRNQVE